MMRKARTQLAATARKPKTTITAIAQCGKPPSLSPDCSPPSEPSELFPPPVEEAPLADEVSDADAEAADADEADAEEADIDDATESAYVVSCCSSSGRRM